MVPLPPLLLALSHLFCYSFGWYLQCPSTHLPPPLHFPSPTALAQCFDLATPPPLFHLHPSASSPTALAQCFNLATPLPPPPLSPLPHPTPAQSVVRHIGETQSDDEAESGGGGGGFLGGLLGSMGMGMGGGAAAKEITVVTLVLATRGKLDIPDRVGRVSNCRVT